MNPRILVALTLGLVIVSLWLARPVSSPSAPVPAESQEIKKLAQQRARAAEDAYKRFLDHKEPNASNNLETLYEWSKRLLEAQRDAAASNEDEVKAFQAHLSRIEGLEKDIKNAWTEILPRLRREQKAAAEYQLALVALYRAEAELWLARAKAKK
jgi:hypothetical protein